MAEKLNRFLYDPKFSLNDETKITVNFTKEDLHKIEQYSNNVVEFHDKLRTGWKNKPSLKESLELGYRGEIAFSKIFNLPINDQLTFGDNGVDFWFYGLSVDVKTISKLDHKLMFSSLEAIKADIIVLFFSHSIESASMLGFTTKDDLLNDLLPKEYFVELDMGFGPRYCLDKKFLKSVKELLYHDLVLRNSGTISISQKNGDQFIYEPI